MVEELEQASEERLGELGFAQPERVRRDLVSSTS